MRAAYALRKTLPGVVFVVALAGQADAQLVVSANESKMTLVDGVNTVMANPKPDTVTVIDLNGGAPRVVGEVQAPASVIGPPQSVAIAPDNSIALVTAATRIDPADPTQTAPDNTVTVVDLRARPVAVLATLHAGMGASGVAINGTGTLALVANRVEGTISVLTIRGRTVTVAGKVDLGAPDSSPSSIAFAPDGRTAMVTRNNDNLLSLLDVKGATVNYAKHDIPLAPKPYAIDVSAKGDIAVVGHVSGTNDPVILLDLTGPVPRVVGRATGGATIESVTLSPDGRYVAATIMNGSNTPASAPNHRDAGLLKIFRVSGLTLAPVTEIDTGHWCQGSVWKRDASMVLVECVNDRAIRMFRFDGRTLTAAGSIGINGGPAGIRASVR
jgi:DNA-binding beta-propeller fold protein YncE